LSNSTDKPSGKKPGGLLDQYNLLGAIIDTSWATRLDHKVARHVIDRYYPKHGNGRASLRYLEQATGALRPNIIASLRRLADNGAIIMVRQGQGTRPTEYALNFDFPGSGIVDDTSSSDGPSGIVGDTSGGIVGDTSNAASGIVDDTESYLQVPAYKAGVLIDRMDCGLATPDVAGLAPASPATPQEELPIVQAEPSFEALWRAYDYAKGKKEAREAWKALPAEVDKAAVIEAAAAWQASWAAQGKPDAPRFTLARWLKDERYDEDAPKGFTKVERGKSASKAKPGGKCEFGIGANIKRYTITDYQTEGSPFADFFETFTFRADDGHEFTKQMHVISATKDYGEGEDVELKHSLYVAAWGKDGVEGNYVGRVVGATDAKGLCFFNVGQPATVPEPWVGDVDKLAPFGTFSATFLDSAVEWNESGQFVTLMLELVDNSSGLEIVRQTKHTFDMETTKGRAFMVSICRSLSIDSIEDTDVLHGKVLECTITERGEISYAAPAAPLQEAA